MAEIRWDMSPQSVLTLSDERGSMTFAEYYRTQYGKTINDMTQPLLVSAVWWEENEVVRGMEMIYCSYSRCLACKILFRSPLNPKIGFSRTKARLPCAWKAFLMLKMVF